MKTSSEWLRYYQQNPGMLLPIPWELGAELTAEERVAIARSVQEFQLGESSEGRHLLQDAADYAARTGDHLYLETMRLFIAEELRGTRGTRGRSTRPRAPSAGCARSRGPAAAARSASRRSAPCGPGRSRRTPRGSGPACAGLPPRTGPPGTRPARASRTARGRRAAAHPTRGRGRRASAGRRLLPSNASWRRLR